MKDLELRIEGGGLWIEDGQLRFEDFMIPHQQLIHIVLVIILCCESRYFEDILNLKIFCLRTI